MAWERDEGGLWWHGREMKGSLVAWERDEGGLWWHGREMKGVFGGMGER